MGAVDRQAVEDPMGRCALQGEPGDRSSGLEPRESGWGPGDARIASAGGGSEAPIISETIDADSRCSDTKDGDNDLEADLGTRFSASKELVGTYICI